MLCLGGEVVFEKIVLVTRKTRLDELIERFNTQAQAKFYIEHAGSDFSAYLLEHDAYQRSLEVVRRRIEIGLKIQVMDREQVLETTKFVARCASRTKGGTISAAGFQTCGAQFLNGQSETGS